MLPTPASAINRVPLTLIAETDGSMIPVVVPGEGADPGADRRKQRTLLWKEAKLSLIRRPEELLPAFTVTLGDAVEAGGALKRLADAVGLKRQTRVHGLGDGAPWIVEQMEVQFGARATYLIDLCHLTDYLSAAASRCDEVPVAWVARQKERLTTGELAAVLAELTAHAEPDTVPSDEAPVRRCQRYIINRPGQFNYPAAIAANLPIGSGEVESAHRYIIQERLKLSGAWWTSANAQAMLNLRCLRANHRWNDYWLNPLAA